jgi:hypothetical protein
MVILAYWDLLNMNRFKKKFQIHTYICNRNLDDIYFENFKIHIFEHKSMFPTINNNK